MHMLDAAVDFLDPQSPPGKKLVISLAVFVSQAVVSVN